MATPTPPLRIVLSYAPEDQSYAVGLRLHLTPLEKSRRLAVWSRDRVPPGAVVAEEARAALDDADVVVALVSADYLASDDLDQELNHAIRVAKHVLPVLARPSRLRGTWFDGRAVLPTGRYALSAHPSPDEAYVEIVDAIEVAAEEGTRGRASPEPNVPRRSSPVPGLAVADPADLRWLPLDEYLEQFQAALLDPDAAPTTLYASVGKADVLRTAMGLFYDPATPSRRPRIARVVVLRLSPEAALAMEERGELSPGYGAALDGNLNALRAMLAAYGTPLEVRITDAPPAFHGFLYGDHLFRGAWQVGPTGALDVNTLLEHRTLQRDPAAHAEFHLAMQPMFREPAKLGLAVREYAIFGSGPMALRGLRDPHDVDVIVTRSAWQRLADTSPVHVEAHEHGLSKIQLGAVEILDGWYPDVGTVDELVQRADVVLGVPFVKLEDVRRWKVAYGRPKDGPDVALIDAYLARLESAERRASRSTLRWRPELGAALRGLRGARTQRDIATTSGLTAQELSELERGLQEPHAETLAALARAYGATDERSLLTTLAGRPEVAPVAGLEAGAKVGQLLRALTLPAHAGSTLLVAAGTGNVTQIVLLRAYQGSAAGCPRPVIAGVRLRRLSDEAIDRMVAVGELEPDFRAELHLNADSIHAVLAGNGIRFDVEELDEIPPFHGYRIGDHAFVGRWAVNDRGFWHTRTPVEHVTRQSGSWPEVWST